MKITKVVVRKVEKENSRIKGIASAILDNCFAVHDIRIIEGEKGLFIAMPSKKHAGTFRDVAHPVDPETRSMFENKIIEAYKNTK